MAVMISGQRGCVGQVCTHSFSISLRNARLIPLSIDWPHWKSVNQSSWVSAFHEGKALTHEDWFTDFQCGQSIDNGINLAFRKEIENEWVQTWPTHPRWPEIITAINTEIDALFLGEKSADQVGNDAAAAVDQLLTSQE